jgi:hypothetical protein
VAVPLPPPVPLAEPQVLAFGDVPGGTTGELTLMLSNSDTLDTVLTSLASSSLAFEVVEPQLSAVINAGGRVSVLVRFNAPLALNGVQRGVLRLATGNGNIAVPLSGRGTRVRVRVEPAVLNFGAVKVGEEVRLSIEISNPGNQPLEVSGLTVASPAFGLEPASFTVAGGESQPLVVRFAPPARGAVSG